MIRVVTIAAVALSGCAQTPFLNRDEPATPVATAPADARPVPRPEGELQTGPEGATAPATPIQAGVTEAATAGELGQATVSLGDPAEPGLWVKTTFVTEEAPGIVRTADGAVLNVTLLPLVGAGGAQMSLQAIQTLGLPLAGLSPVTIARAG
ncbi:MAG: hypothetical protein AAF264_08590 [Pseudomonadota bacterium]